MKLEDSETWIQVEDRLPDVFAGKFRVRKRDGIEMDAFYYADKMAWTAFYGCKLSHWWDAHGTHDRLDDVTHWKR
jgi:hypothetical protein